MKTKTQRLDNHPTLDLGLDPIQVQMHIQELFPGFYPLPGQSTRFIEVHHHCESCGQWYAIREKITSSTIFNIARNYLCPECEKESNVQ